MMEIIILFIVYYILTTSLFVYIIKSQSIFEFGQISFGQFLLVLTPFIRYLYMIWFIWL